MPICMVNTCRYSWRKRDKDHIRLHVFPRDPERIRQWLQCIHTPVSQVDNLAYRIANDKSCIYRICSKHFPLECYELRGSNPYLKKDAEPKLELGNPQPDIDDFSMEHNYAGRLTSQAEETEEVQLVDTMLEDSESSLVMPPYLSPDCEMSSTSTPGKAYTESLGGLVNELIVETTEDYFPLPVEISEPFLEQVNLPAVPKKKKRRYVRTVASVGVATDPPELRHVATSIHRSIIYRRVGIQCNLARLPPLQKFPPRQHPQASRTIVSVPQNHPEINPLTYIVGYEDRRSFNPQRSKAIKVASTTDKPVSVSEDSSNSRGRSRDKDYIPTLEEEEEYETEIQNNKYYEEDIDTSRVLMTENNLGLTGEAKFIVYDSCLNKLLFNCRCPSSAHCSGKIKKIKKRRIGSAVSVTSYCANNHEGHLWSSQPFIRGVPAGNILISSGTLLSGNSFPKIQSFFNVTGLLGISATTHYQNQGAFIFPAIDYRWQKERKQLLDYLKHKQVALIGDGQCDSLGSDAMYCTYTMLDCASKKVVDFQVEHVVRSVSPVALEKKACKIALDRLLQDRLDIRLFFTDRHVGIRKMMRLKYSDIKHRFSVWHLARSIEKKLKQASKLKDCRSLSLWIAPTKDHLWWAANTCQGIPELLKEKWLSICRHVINEHQWDDCMFYMACDHPPIDSEAHRRKWLKKGSPAHYKFLEIVRNTTLLKDLEHVSYVCHTDEMEVFRSEALKYHSKRDHSIGGIIARTQLATLDHNHNVGRLQPVKSTTSYSSELDALRHSHGKTKDKQDLTRNLLRVIFRFAEGELP